MALIFNQYRIKPHVKKNLIVVQGGCRKATLGLTEDEQFREETRKFDKLRICAPDGPRNHAASPLPKRKPERSRVLR